MSSRIDAASECFTKGFNCAQAVFFAYASHAGVSEEDALRIAASFGGGMGRQQVEEKRLSTLVCLPCVRDACRILEGTILNAE